MDAELLTLLRSAKNHLAAHFPIRSLGVFGSVARGEARPDSDIDILIEFSRPIGWEIVDIQQYLEGITKRHVDLVTPGAVKPLMKEYIYNELQVV